MTRRLTLIAVSLLFPCTLQAQRIKISPTLLQSEDSWLPAVRLSAALDGSSMDLEGRPSEKAWSLKLDAPVVWDSKRNPESLRATGDYGWEKSLKNEEGSLEVREDDPLDWGFLRLQGGLELEAPQTFEVFTGGIAVVGQYAHREPRIWFVPNLRAALGAVGCLRCTVEDEAAFYVKFDADAAVTVPLRSFQLRLRGRGFTSAGAPDEVGAEIVPNGVGGSAELAYRKISSKQWWEVFVRWAGGETPVTGGDRKAWAAGLTFGF